MKIMFFLKQSRDETVIPFYQNAHHESVPQFKVLLRYHLMQFLLTKFGQHLYVVSVCGE